MESVVEDVSIIFQSADRSKNHNQNHTDLNETNQIRVRYLAIYFFSLLYSKVSKIYFLTIKLSVKLQMIAIKQQK